ncbi:hypothetical protein C8J57DRAFT_1492738 [Mycena rebaudengoi]|nr:hypothetical protein C8J57DRAFT_1521602 [Mycena rebaudengoi]KAJ7292245.1 hypothetical protein C8J57DRAFT_1492738 [Mycena rebaudengoi]
MFNSNPCRKLIVYTPWPTSQILRFSWPRPYVGNLQSGERCSCIDYSLYLMYAISNSDDTESDDDQIPDLIECVNSSVKSKL